MYTEEDMKLRKAWMAEIVSKKTAELLEQVKLGNTEYCKCMQTKIKVSLAYLDILCYYDPTEEYNHLSETMVDKIVNNFSEFFEVCFYPKALA